MSLFLGEMVIFEDELVISIGRLAHARFNQILCLAH